MSIARHYKRVRNLSESRRRKILYLSLSVIMFFTVLLWVTTTHILLGTEDGSGVDSTNSSATDLRILKLELSETFKSGWQKFNQ